VPTEPAAETATVNHAFKGGKKLSFLSKEGKPKHPTNGTRRGEIQ